jgi:hypothetical protein
VLTECDISSECRSSCTGVAAAGEKDACRKAHFALNGRNFNKQTVTCYYYEESDYAKGALADPSTLVLRGQQSGTQKRLWNQLEKQYDMGLVTQHSRSGLGSWQYRR